MTDDGVGGPARKLEASDAPVVRGGSTVLQRPATAGSLSAWGNVLSGLRGRLVVSCQAPPGHPLSELRSIVAMCICAEQGGAAGVRVEGSAAVRAAKDAVGVPVIGLKKVWVGSTSLGRGRAAITPEVTDAVEIASAGADIVAIEATKELRGQGVAAHLRAVSAELEVPVLADVSTLDEGIAAFNAGAQVVGTTLSGYTAYSVPQKNPDLSLVADLVARHVPTVAEGRISCPEEGVAAIASGALFVIVGKTITDPLARTAAFEAVLGERRREARL